MQIRKRFFNLLNILIMYEEVTNISVKKNMRIDDMGKKRCTFAREKQTHTKLM